MEKTYGRPKTILDGAISGFCPGCLHSTINKLIAQVVEEMDMQDRAVDLFGIGCGGTAQEYLDMDLIFGGHGRSCAVATGLKRARPDLLVFTYQGDGDAASIGLAETLSAANRGENFTVFFINNLTYGMTGGQLAPTTLVGMKATTAPFGRDPGQHGYPMHMVEILNELETPAYLTRVTCDTPAHIREAKSAIRKAFQYQLDGKGFSFVEFLSNCPTNWGLSPKASLEFIKEKQMQEYPLGEVRAR